MKTSSKKIQRRRVRISDRNQKRLLGRHDRFSNPARLVSLLIMGYSQDINTKYVLALSLRVYHNESAEIVSSTRVMFRPTRIIGRVINDHSAFQVSIDELKFGKVHMLFKSLPIQMFQDGIADLDGPLITPDDKVIMKTSCKLLKEKLKSGL